MADPRGVARPTTLRPAGFCVGRGHVLVYGNGALRTLFGDDCIGLPAREGLLGLPAEAFTLMDAVLDRGRPLARWIRRDGREWRMTVAPRIDPLTDETYGVAVHLRQRTDPVVRDSGAA